MNYFDLCHRAFMAAAIVFLVALAFTVSAAPAGAATNLTFGSEACQANGTVTGRLAWTPSGAGSQYVDLATDAGFSRFNTGGPFAATANSVELTSLSPGATYFARVNTVSGTQTLTSDVLRITARTCEGAAPVQPAQVQNVGAFQLVNLFSGKCLEIYGFSQANFGAANQWACWGGPNQTVQATRLADGYYELRFVHSGKCLEVMNWSRANAAPIGQYDCHGGDNQRWGATITNGAVSLVWSKFSGKCLDVYGWARHDGAAVVQWDCHGGANQQWRSVARGTGGAGPTIAITIDTDSIRGYAPRMLDILDAYGVKASFGVVGQWAVNNPDLVQRMAASGHTLMNHSWSHPFFTAISSAARQNEIRWTDEAIQQIAGVTTKPYFRPPYGDTNAAVRADAAAVGHHREILWSIDPQGWRGYSGTTITNHILTHAFDGGVILMHSTSAGDLAALGPTLEGLLSRGYRIVTISQLYP